MLDTVPDQLHQIIARIESRSATVFTAFTDLRGRIVAQAAQLGADAVVVGPGSTKTEFIILPPGIVSSERKTLTAEIIVFPERVRAPASALGQFSRSEEP